MPLLLLFLICNHAALIFVSSRTVEAPDPCEVPPTPSQPTYPLPEGAKNVLFIVSDDLRPELMRAYGQKHMITPHLDQLTERATTFQRAYCQQAICGPSRNSFLSGRRPQRTQSWNFIDHFREPICGDLGDEPARTEDGREWQSLPGWFKNHGYTVLGSGKAFHPHLPPDEDGSLSWSEDMPYVDHGDKKTCESQYIVTGKGNSVCPDAGAFNATDTEGFTDYKNLQAALANLQYASATGNPFFVSFGLHKPHLPFHFPATFPDANGVAVDHWDAYSDVVELPTYAEAPIDMPPIAFTYEMDGKTKVCVGQECQPIPGSDMCPFCGPALPDNVTRAMRRGYYSAVSWADYCVGAIVSELALLGHDDDTVVLIVGDHGWQLGEHNIWGKHSNFELGTRVPLIIRAPGQRHAVATSALVESVDIYPTLSALAGLGEPPDVDGVNLSPLWEAPAQELKGAVFSEYPRQSNCLHSCALSCGPHARNYKTISASHKVRYKRLISA